MRVVVQSKITNPPHPLTGGSPPQPKQLLQKITTEKSRSMRIIRRALLHRFMYWSQGNLSVSVVATSPACQGVVTRGRSAAGTGFAGRDSLIAVSNPYASLCDDARQYVEGCGGGTRLLRRPARV